MQYCRDVVESLIFTILQTFRRLSASKHVRNWSVFDKSYFAYFFWTS